SRIHGNTQHERPGRIESISMQQSGGDAVRLTHHAKSGTPGGVWRKAANTFRVLAAIAALCLGTADLVGASGHSSPKERTPAAIAADEFFWEVFNGGDYDSIPAILEAMTAAYLGDPTDAITAAHIGWTYLWRSTEQLRMEVIPPTITNDPVLARKFFDRAVHFDRADARYLSDLAAGLIAEGYIHNQPKLVRRGNRLMRTRIRAFPEFNLFTNGYTQSRLPSDSPPFKKGLKDIWKNVDVCIGEKFDRDNPDMSPYLHLATTVGPKRVCWNGGWIAPHNFEGFFLNFGDVLVKAGQWQTAQKVYANAKLVPEYSSWAFASMLEERILRAEENVEAFNAPPDENGRLANPIMSQSPAGCLGCHQN
ncbi:MAG: hypothetical protein ABFS02_13300, partial [Pseudomonadota bacterium]